MTFDVLPLTFTEESTYDFDVFLKRQFFSADVRITATISHGSYGTTCFFIILLYERHSC
jgi:hypothetical protein